MNNLDKALALARLGIKVFPADKNTRAPKLSEKDGGRGFYDATLDSEQIATWFTVDYKESTTVVAVWAGGSDLLALDVDKGKSNGKDGFAALEERGRDNALGITESYKTASGGEHHIWDVSDREEIAPAQDLDGMEGIDVRAGASYFIWWGKKVPTNREAFSKDVPEWLALASAAESAFTGEGFSGSVTEWLDTISQKEEPSTRVREFVARVPGKDFSHPEMVQLAWEIVRLGSEREAGVRKALETLRSEWLRGQYNTPAYRQDFDKALRGAINKGGLIQEEMPVVGSTSLAMTHATKAGIANTLKSLNDRARKIVTESAAAAFVSETTGISVDQEIELSRIRKEMFQVAAEAGLNPADSFTLVVKSKALESSVSSPRSVWFGEGEPLFRAAMELALAEPEGEIEGEPTEEEWTKKTLAAMVKEAEEFTLLSAAEQAAAEAYDWWGKDYLTWVKSRLKHFNKPYHVSSMWAVLSVIASPWGKVPLPGAKPTDCNLYLIAPGVSTSGKSEAWGFGLRMLDAYYGLEGGPIIGDVQKMSALAMHRELILRDNKPSLVFGDEIQAFFQGVASTQWQNGILGDLSSHYGGDVSPKLTLNDKEISGKRARTLLTAYLTGISTQLLETISINHWTSGFFYRFLWNFGQPRVGGDYEVEFETSAADYTAEFEKWAKEFKRVGEYQMMKHGGEGRIVGWDEDARKRLSAFKKQIDEAVNTSSLYDDVFVAANDRFAISVMKCATLVTLAEGADTVSLNHLLVALSFAGPWHRSMVMAVSETGKEPFERETEKALAWIRRNANRSAGRKPWIQRTAVMREFRPNEIADRLLRQLTEEGWLARSGDVYELSEG